MRIPPVPPRTTPSGSLVHDGITFSEVPGFRPLLLDLWVPAAVVNPPLVVWIHGGAFQFGDRRGLPATLPPDSVFEALTSAGLACATIDYRLSGEAHFPAQLQDVDAALDYLSDHAAQLHINADRIGVWGESAGGTLAALAGLTGGRVSAVVGWYPLTDMLTAQADRDGSPEARLLGARPSADPGRAAQASPITHVSAVAPPFLLMHGLADRTLPISHSERLHSLLIAAGARSTYRPITGADHCFENHHDIPGLIDESVTFLAKELGA